jgi:glutathione S-transferase
MTAARHVTLFHSANTRSSGVLVLLEELNADYELHVLNMYTDEQRAPAYLAINPMGKVPAIQHGAALVTEQVAIYLYLADLYPEAGLAPPIGDPLRGPYLRWMAFYGSCFEPGLVDRALKREPPPRSMSPYGDYDTLFNAMTTQLSKGKFFLGDRFYALDVLWASSLTWMMGFKLVPSLPLIVEYTERVNARPSIARVKAIDARIEAQQKGQPTA